MADFRAKAKPTVPEIMENDEEDQRSRLVRVPRFADDRIFGGWGVKI